MFFATSRILSGHTSRMEGADGTIAVRPSSWRLTQLPGLPSAALGAAALAASPSRHPASGVKRYGLDDE
jgi:hypothetical protein